MRAMNFFPFQIAPAALTDSGTAITNAQLIRVTAQAVRSSIGMTFAAQSGEELVNRLEPRCVDFFLKK
jgi:hypothetical protein